MNFDIESINNKLIAPIIIVMFLVIGGVFGYSVALLEQSKLNITYGPPVKQSVQVLGIGVSPYYVNPFEVVDAKDVQFPVAQLRGCRNWNECNNYCETAENYQSCSSWSHTLK